MIDNIKLTGPNAIKGYNPEQHNKNALPENTSTSVSQDVEISQQAKIIDKLMSEPEPIQQEKIATIKNAIANGNYNIDHEQLAEAIIHHLK